VLGAVALVALAVGVVGPALGSSRNDEKRRTLRFVAVNTESNFIDLGEQGDTLGDYFVFRHKLLRRGEQVGHVSGQCTIVSVAGAESEPQCVVTASLRGGQITSQVLIGPHGATGDILQAITGGSGRYTGAEGDILIQGVTDSKEIWTFHLED
jgi:hypothetical protein